jgi:methionyl-tRNA formyltransferase
MRVAFAGTPAFAARALAAILEAGFAVPVVLTQPDRPAGRGLKATASPVKELALARSLPLLQPLSLRSDETRAPVLAIPADVLVVAAYGLILPPEVLAWPRAGCINVHASLLPRWRGAAPIQRAILAGDRVSGVSIMQMDAGLDTGPVIATAQVAIGARDTAGTLHDRLAAAGAAAVVDALRRLERDGRLAARAQPDEGVTYAAKLAREDAAIDWTRDSVQVDRQVRALSPSPGAVTHLAGERLKVWAAHPLPDRPSPGPGIVAGADGRGIVVGCGAGVLQITELQLAGGRRLAAAAFLSGRPLAPGTRLGPER